MSEATMPITRQQLEDFTRNGFVCVRGLFSGERVRRIEHVYDHIVAGEYDVEGWQRQIAAGRLMQLSCPSQHVPELVEIGYIQVMNDVASALMGSVMRYAYDQAIMKPAGETFETPWHQDAGYWRNDEAAASCAITCWLAVAPVSEAQGCMQFIPGSHMEGIQDHYSVAHRNPIGGALETAVEVDKAVKVPLNAGDVTFHHCRTLHYTDGNHGDQPRKGLVTHFFRAK